MRKRHTHRFSKQSNNSNRGVKHLSHEVGVAPNLLRIWLRKKFGRHYQGNWQWRFTEADIARIAATYRKERRRWEK
jgi:hypothetical protein